MVKRVLTIVGIVLGLVAGCALTFFLTNSHYTKELENQAARMAALEATLQDIGDIGTCYTVRTEVKPGTQLTEDLLEPQSIPMSFITEDFCELSDIIGTPTYTDENGKEHPATGYYAKTYITPGTPITKSLVMVEPIVDSLREIDLTANRWPIGLTEGDYVDLRLTYPYGEDFLVLSHKRVMSISEQTLKMHLTEEEQHIYGAALVDYYLGEQEGTDLYFTKYVEPGVQQPATTYYSIPANIAAICQLDPNIKDKAETSVKETLRNAQEKVDHPFSENESDIASFIAAGRARLNSMINSDYQDWHQEYEQKKQQDAENANDDSLISGGVE